MFGNIKKHNQIDVPEAIQKFGTALDAQINDLRAFRALKDKLPEFIKNEYHILENEGFTVLSAKSVTKQTVRDEKYEDGFEAIEVEFAKIVTNAEEGMAYAADIYGKPAEWKASPYTLVVTTSTVKAEGTSVMIVDKKDGRNAPKMVGKNALVYNVHGKRLVFASNRGDKDTQLVPYDTEFDANDVPSFYVFGINDIY